MSVYSKEKDLLVQTLWMIYAEECILSDMFTIFIIGFIVPRKEAMEIYIKVTNKLEKLLLKINFVKFNICHSSSKNIKYFSV